MYRALKTFVLPSEGCRIYHAGDPFPREGDPDPDPDLLASLMGEGGPLIEEIRETEEPKVERPTKKRKR